MDQDKLREGIEYYKKLPQDMANQLFTAMSARTPDWWKSIDYGLEIKLTNYLRSADLGENALFGPGQGSLHKITKSGKPFYVVMLEQAFPQQG